MKYNVMGLLFQAAVIAKKSGDGGLAYGLYEMANNLRLLMRGEATLAEWNNLYVGADREPFDIERLLPVMEDDS